MNLLFFLTPKQDVLYIYEDFTLRQTLEKWSNQRYATIPVLKRNGEYVGSITEGDILWGMKNLHGLDLEASEDVPISSFPRRRDYKAVTVTTDMPTLLKAAIEQNFVPVVDDRNVFIGMVRRTVLLREMYDKYTTLPTDKRFKGSHPRTAAGDFVHRPQEEKEEDRGKENRVKPCRGRCSSSTPAYGRCLAQKNRCSTEACAAAAFCFSSFL